MAPGEVIRRMSLSDLNGSGDDLDLTLSLSVGDSRGKKAVVSLEQTGRTHIANPRSTEFGHNPYITSTTCGKSINRIDSGASAYCPVHGKSIELELSASARSTSSVVMSEESRSIQGSVSTVTRSTGASVLERYRLHPHLHRHPSINSTNRDMSTVSHMPCVTVRDSSPGTPRATGFIYQVSSAADVVIVCNCHWRAFTAAGFVEHAGLTNVKNPLREIVVLPPGLTCMIGPD